MRDRCAVSGGRCLCLMGDVRCRHSACVAEGIGGVKSDGQAVAALVHLVRARMSVCVCVCVCVSVVRVCACASEPIAGSGKQPRSIFADKKACTHLHPALL